MRNDYAGTEGVAHTLIFLVISLTFSAAVISWMLLQIYGVSVAGINLPQDTFGGFSTNFIANTNTDNVLVASGTWGYVAGVGRIASDGSTLLFDKVMVNNDGSYINTYTINNSVQKSYSIILEYWDVSNYNVLYVGDNGFDVYEMRTNLITGVSSNSVYHYDYPNANKLQNTIIQTVYSPEASPYGNRPRDSLLVNLNGNELFRTGLLPSYGTYFSTPKYGGVMTAYGGVTISEFSTVNDQSSNDLVSLLSQTVAWILSAFKIVAWNVDSAYLPIEINVILIKTQLFGIIACLIIIARG